MGLLGRLLKRPADTDTLAPPVCTHRILVARWDNPEDIGHEERVTSYKYESCSKLFTAEIGRELMNMV
jgi:hypothetical protein